MNRVTSGIFGIMGLLIMSGVLLNDIGDSLDTIDVVDSGFFIMFILGALVAWVFYIGVTTAKGGRL